MKQAALYIISPFAFLLMVGALRELAIGIGCNQEVSWGVSVALVYVALAAFFINREK